MGGHTLTRNVAWLWLIWAIPSRTLALGLSGGSLVRHPNQVLACCLTRLPHVPGLIRAPSSMDFSPNPMLCFHGPGTQHWFGSGQRLRTVDFGSTGRGSDTRAGASTTPTLSPKQQLQAPGQELPLEQSSSVEADQVCALPPVPCGRGVLRAPSDADHRGDPAGR